MFVTFNPNLANNKSFRNNCMAKKVAFQKIDPKEAASCAHSAAKLGSKFIRKQESVDEENLGLLRQAIRLAKGETQGVLKGILKNNWGLTA